MPRFAALTSFLTVFWITSQSALGQSAPESKPVDLVDPDPAQADPDPAQADPDPAQADPDPAQADPDPAQADPDPAQADPVMVPPEPSVDEQTTQHIQPSRSQPGTTGTSPAFTAPSPKRFVPRGERFRTTQPPGYHIHDSLFFRLTLGVGYARFKDDGPLGTSFKGDSRSGGISLGFTVIPNVVVFGEISGISLNNPTISAGNIKTRNTQISASGVGLGASYYLPSNVYLGASFILSRIAGHIGEDNIDLSDVGLVVHANAGKELWVSDNWGLGLALQLSGGSISSGPDGGKINQGILGITLLATATFN